MVSLEKLSNQLGYKFKDESLLKRALTHRSIPGRNNERLEFLGDSILNFIIADELFLRYPRAREGALSRLRANLVKGETLAILGRKFDLGSYLHLGAGELKSGGHERASILADAVEAVIGAIYLDADFEVCKRLVLSWYATQLMDLSTLTVEKDAKTLLQEYLQAKKYPLPEYKIKSITGKAHRQTFYVQCTVEGMLLIAEGSATSRRKAEQSAAKLFLELLNEKY